MIDQIIIKQWDVKRMPKRIIPRDTLAMRAKVEREKLGLTQKEMAERLSAPPFNIQITTSGYSKIEKATTETPHRDVLRAMKRIFGVSIDYLLDGEEPEADRVIDVFISEEANQGGALIDKMSPDLRTFAIQMLTNIDSIDQMFKEKNENLERTAQRLRLRRDQMAQLLDAAMADMKEPAQRRARSLLHDIDSQTE